MKADVFGERVGGMVPPFRLLTQRHQQDIVEITAHSTLQAIDTRSPIVTYLIEGQRTSVRCRRAQFFNRNPPARPFRHLLTDDPGESTWNSENTARLSICRRSR